MLITISREYAAGGSEVARLVADTLGWRVFDDELVRKVAERAGLPPEEVARREERVPSFIDRFARATALTSPELFLPNPGPVEPYEEEKLAQITRAIVEELAREGRMVVVGRAAAAVLARDTGTLRVRVVAPVEFRVRMAIERLGLDAAEAQKRLDQTDLNRARYHTAFYQRDWADPTLYDIVLNTGVLGFAGAAELIVARARALGWTD